MPSHPVLPAPDLPDLPPAQAPGPLLDLVRAAAADRALWAPAVRFDRGRRHWSRLLTAPDVDLWLLTWLPDQSTDLHDHGGASAAVTVLSGALEEVRAAPDGTLTRSTVRAGDAVWVPPTAVHDVANRGPEPAVSLHAYSPRLSAMTFWAADGGRLRALRTVATDEPELQAAS